MANRFSKMTTSTYQPLSMQEIMAVPMAMQKQHDDLQLKADEAALLDAKYGTADKEGAMARVSELRSKANDISNSLGDTGFDKNLLRKFKALKAETDLEYGKNGYLGVVESNAAAQSKFVNDLATDKARQAGWSPQEANAWAQRQVSEFGPSRNADGSYNTFSGRELVTKFEGEDELLDKAIERVAEKVTPATISLVKSGGIGALEKAYRTRTIEQKDYITLMDAMVTAASTNPDLIRSLRQEAEMYNIEDPLDFGAFDTINEPVLDKEGNPVMKKGVAVTRPVTEFTPGKSRMGQKIAGFGRAAQYVNPKDAITIKTDEAAKIAFERGQDAATAAGMVNIANGELNSVTAATFDTDLELMRTGKENAKIIKMNLDKLKDRLAENGATPEQIAGDKEVQRLNSEWRKSTSKYSNAEQRLNHVSRKADEGLTKSQKNRIRFQDMIAEKYSGHLNTDGTMNDIDGNPTIDFERILFEEYGETITNYSEDPNNPVVGDHDPKEVSSVGWASKASRDKMALKILEQKNGLDNTVVKGDVLTNTNHGFSYQSSKLKDDRKDLRNEYLIANPTAEYFNVFSGSGAGKNYSELGGRNKILTENFNPLGATLAYGRGMLTDNEEYQDLVEGLPTAEVPEVKVFLTDGQDDDGTYFTNVQVTSSHGTGSFQVLDGNNNGALSDMFTTFLSGNADQQRIGQQGLANLAHMKNIKASGFGGQPQGTLDVNIGNNQTIQATYTKDRTEQFYAVTIDVGGTKVPISDQPIYSKADLSLKLAAAVEEINAQIEKEKDPDYDPATDNTLVRGNVSPSVQAILDGQTAVIADELNYNPEEVSFIPQETIDMLMQPITSQDQTLEDIDAEFESEGGIAPEEAGVSTPDNMNEYVDPLDVTNEETPEGDPETMTAELDTVVKSVKKGQTFTFGTNQVTITDPYGIRNFSGREGQHSTGVDYRTDSGNVVALTDGVIKEVRLQGDGSRITPTQGSAAGYYLIVEQADGSMAQYMHLDPMTKEEMKSLVGKQITKGEELWGYSQGSGSMTKKDGQWGVHVKYRMYEKGKVPKQSHKDPSVLFQETPKQTATEQPASEVSPESRQLLDFIGKFESKGGDPNILYGGFKGTTEKPLTEMTIDEVFALQTRMVSEQRKDNPNKQASSAVGSHQFISKTLKEEVKRQKISGDTLFTAEVQDSIMINRLKNSRGFDKFLSGEISDVEFAESLSKEFASMPNPSTNRSYYDGDGLNSSLVEIQKVLDMLKKLKTTSTK